MHRPAAREGNLALVHKSQHALIEGKRSFEVVHDDSEINGVLFQSDTHDHLQQADRLLVEALVVV